MYLANLDRNRRPFSWGTKKNPHNNRKMTAGRKERRHSIGGRKGYVPNELVVAHKNLSRFKRKLKSLKELEGNALLDASDKILHLENLIRKYQSKIDNYDS